jgi:hypothetical protein
MTHPVPAAANAGYCDVCQLPTVYGIGAAIRAGLVVLIDFGPAAVPAEVIQ